MHGVENCVQSIGVCGKSCESIFRNRAIDKFESPSSMHGKDLGLAEWSPRRYLKAALCTLDVTPNTCHPHRIRFRT